MKYVQLGKEEDAEAHKWRELFEVNINHQYSHQRCGRKAEN